MPIDLLGEVDATGFALTIDEKGAKPVDFRSYTEFNRLLFVHLVPK